MSTLRPIWVPGQGLPQVHCQASQQSRGTRGPARDILRTIEIVKKQGGSFLPFQRVDCLISTGKDYPRLGANVLTDPISPLILLSSNLVAKVFQGLINSGSLDCLIDSSFVATHKLPFSNYRPTFPNINRQYHQLKCESSHNYHKLYLTITPRILVQFPWSKMCLKALMKTFQTMLKIYQSNQYSLRYQLISTGH